MWYVCICVCVCTCTHAHTHRVEYYSVLEKEGNLPICNIQMKVEDIILSEISQIEKHSVWCHLFVNLNNNKKIKTNEPIETESKMVVARGWKVQKMGKCCPKGTNFQL